MRVGGGGGKGREDTDTAIRGSSRLGSWCMFSSDLRQGSGKGKEEAAPSNAVLGPIRTCHDPTPHQSPDQAKSKTEGRMAEVLTVAPGVVDAA